MKPGASQPAQTFQRADHVFLLNRMKILKKSFAFRKAFDYISAPRQTQRCQRDTVRCPSGLRSTPGKCVYKKLYRGFESLLHRHIRYTKSPDIPCERRGFFVSEGYPRPTRKLERCRRRRQPETQHWLPSNTTHGMLTLASGISGINVRRAADQTLQLAQRSRKIT